MPLEPKVKRAVAFVDGQNLYHAAREAFGRPYPDYDVVALATNISESSGWSLIQTRFYTGVPDAADNPFWHQFWSAKLAAMGARVCTSSPARFATITVLSRCLTAPHTHSSPGKKKGPMFASLWISSGWPIAANTMLL